MFVIPIKYTGLVYRNASAAFLLYRNASAAFLDPAAF